MIVLYTIGCPKCNVLKSKLDQKGVQYIICSNIEEMKEIGIADKPFPMLGIDGKILDFHDANEWVNRWKDG